METRVFYFTGMLGSGKTTFIDKTLADLREDQKLAVICCEAGDEEITVEGIPVVYTDKLTHDVFKDLEEQYAPEFVFIEDDGNRPSDPRALVSQLPKDWGLVQFVTMINAKTFERYMIKAPNLLMDKIRLSSMVIFNRCTDELAELIRDQNLRMVNRSAEYWLEFEDHHVESIIREGESFFDLSGDEIFVNEEEFPVWYTEALDFPGRFDGLTVNLDLMVDHEFEDDDYDVAGLWIMTCCAEDVQFFPVACKKGFLKDYETETLLNVTAIVSTAEWEGYEGEGPILEIIDAEVLEPPIEFEE